MINTTYCDDQNPYYLRVRIEESVYWQIEEGYYYSVMMHIMYQDVWPVVDTLKGQLLAEARRD